MAAAALLVATPTLAQQEKKVGIVERLGKKAPIAELTFKDEAGKTVTLGSLFDRPVVLSLVYFRCPGICTPLLHETSQVVQKSDLTAGEDYQLITVSFDPAEGPELAAMKRVNMLGAMKKRPIQKSAWRFLTGDEANIKRLADAVGFKYVRDKNGQDFVHGATLTFLSKDGMIARYLQGTRFNPADFDMAVMDASEGRARSFMKKIQRLCFAYEPGSHSYVLKVNRLILGLTMVFVVGFVAFLIASRARRPQGGDAPDPEEAT